MIYYRITNNLEVNDMMFVFFFLKTLSPYASLNDNKQFAHQQTNMLWKYSTGPRVKAFSLKKIKKTAILKGIAFFATTRKKHLY